jgi:hypothetical protein
MADPYRPQLSADPTALPGSSPEAFGAPLARGLEDAGAAIDRTLHRLREQHRDNEAAAAGAELAQVSQELDKTSIDARTTAAAGGAGHTEGIMKAFDTRSTDALAKIRDPKIREAFTARYADLKENLFGREYGWEAAARVAKLGDDYDHMTDTLANGQAAHPDIGGLQVSFNTIDSTVHAMQIGDDTKEKLAREGKRKVAIAFANRLQDDHPEMLVGDQAKGVAGLLDRPEFNKYLEPDDLKALRSGAHVEIRRSEAEARAARSREEAAAREEISLIGKRTGAGDFSVSDAEFDHAAALAKTYDLKGPAFDLANWKDQRDVNREYRTASPTQIHTDINALEAKGDKRSPNENLRLEHLKAVAPSLISTFNNDPYAAAAAGGHPAPELDPTDAKSVQGRVTWAISYARSAGLVNVPYLNPDETKTLRDEATTGPTGQLSVAAQLHGTFGVAIGGEIARQIDPNNKDLQLMVGLHPTMGATYRRGVEALKAGTVKLGADGLDSQADAERLRSAFADYMPAIPVDMQPAVLNAAKAIEAGIAAEHGRNQLTGDELETFFRAAVQRAGGRSGVVTDYNAPGGFALWNGRYAWLPQTVSSNDFIRKISRAGDAAWLKAGGGAPYYLGTDGKLAKMSDKQIAHFKEYGLETVNPGLYRLVGPDGGHVVDAKGQPWQFDIRQLP